MLLKRRTGHQREEVTGWRRKRDVRLGFGEGETEWESWREEMQKQEITAA